jgi:hypothetical protein
MKQRLTDTALEIPEGDEPIDPTELSTIATVDDRAVKKAAKAFKKAAPKEFETILEAAPED